MDNISICADFAMKFLFVNKYLQCNFAKQRDNVGCLEVSFVENILCKRLSFSKQKSKVFTHV